jgi:predicted ATP-grasp superfamily ATP-dependent carboligase
MVLGPEKPMLSIPTRLATPVLLTVADFYGTLACVRCLGRAGIPVTTADPSLLAPASWSRYTTSRVRCPDPRDSDPFIDWLLHFGKRSPKHVLLPTSDDTAWQFSRHRAELERYFYLNQSPIEAVYGLLNKRVLCGHAKRAGLDFPRCWFPKSNEDLQRCMEEAVFPVLIKPTTQVMFRTRSKGSIVERPESLAAAYRTFSSFDHDGSLTAFDPDAVRPMIQEFYPAASESIYNISGFIHDDEVQALRAGRKLLQWPSRLGVGLCFEDADVDEELARGLGRMARQVGFNGVFEAEFIMAQGRKLLIDFNPRFFNQTAFDVARGVPLPLLAYHAALGDSASAGVQGSTNGAAHPKRVFANRSTMRFMLLAHRLTGRRSSDEIEAWGKWYERHRERCTDAVRDDGDPMPALFDLANRVRRYARHPRDFVVSLLQR